MPHALGHAAAAVQMHDGGEGTRAIGLRQIADERRRWIKRRRFSALICDALLQRADEIARAVEADAFFG
jgi:hypothetical protein